MNRLQYPPYQVNGALPPRSRSASTRLFSKVHVDRILRDARDAYAAHTRAHCVSYQAVRTPLDARIVFLGDLHSSIYALCVVLDWCRSEHFFADDALTLKPGHFLILLGDLVDRGPFGVDILVLVFRLKLANPRNFFVCNGNHETFPVYNRYGLRDEVAREYSTSS